MKELGSKEKQKAGRGLNNQVENSHLPFDDENARCNDFDGCVV